MVRDLESRNGTDVGGELLSGRRSRPLSHHDVITVGKYSFRVSIRDSVTNRPVTFEVLDSSTLSGVKKDSNTHEADQLLSELDALASQINPPKLSIDELRDRAMKKDSFSEEESKMRDLSTVAAKDEMSAANTTTLVGDPDETTGMEDHGLKPVDSTNVGATPDAELASKEHSGNQEVGEDEKEVSGDAATDKEPQRLPDHLRPRGPKDSQGAASEALRNLFLK